MLSSINTTVADMEAEMKLNRSLDFTKYGGGLATMLEVMKFDYLDFRFDSWIANKAIQKGLIVLISSKVAVVPSIIQYSNNILKELNKTLFTPNVTAKLIFSNSIK
jgi:hypothetical protein